MTTLEMAVETHVDAHAELTLRVGRRWIAADGVLALELRNPQGGELPGWAAGAHIDLVLPDGSARQYSLCGNPRDRDTWTVAVLREAEGRGGSRWVHDELNEGELIVTRGPRNHFRLEEASRYIFIGGGIGITPMLPMVATAHATGAEYSLIYGGRSRSSMAFLDDLSAYTGQVEVQPQDEVGIIDLDRILADPTPNTLIYCCGPSPLLDAVEARVAHWPAGSLRTERFSPRTDVEMSTAGDQAFEVELAQEGRVLEVPADRSLLSVLEDAGADVVSSCAEGTCGSCETPVLSGEIDHRDSVLTEAERAQGDRIMICVSRCNGARLVLDI